MLSSCIFLWFAVPESCIVKERHLYVWLPAAGRESWIQTETALPYAVLSLYPLVKLQKRQEKEDKWLSFAPFQSELWCCDFNSAFYLLLLFACFLFHNWQLVKRGCATRRHAVWLQSSAGEVSRSSSVGAVRRWKKCDRCHYVWRLAWRGLALSPVWDARPVPKSASHKCESQAGEGAEQGVQRGKQAALERWEPASATAKQTEGQQAADQSLLCHRGDWLRCCAAESKLTVGRLCACVTL